MNSARDPLKKPLTLFSRKKKGKKKRRHLMSLSTKKTNLNVKTYQIRVKSI